MSKTNRGRGIRKTYNRSRGECPVCLRTGVKLRHQITKGEQQYDVCKPCYAKYSRHTKK
ncbi:MAG TPA: hypothetical protein VKS21_12330 [Spirochaetota bacterium]|nr:hypothetical protein [Spirochaetota bacterium]